VAGLVFGRAAAQDEIVAQVQGVLGAAGAETIESMIERASQPASGIVATLLSLATMAFGASGVFGQLQGSLNRIWGAETVRRRGVKGQVQRRLLAFSMILGTGFLLLVSLALSAVLAGVHRLLSVWFPVLSEFLPLANFLLSFAIVTALFAMIFKLLPDARIEWRDVWLGAAVTALCSIGKSLIGIYLGRAGVTSVYGAAGSLVLILLWVYYSSQLLFLGAEFTEVYSRRYGSRQRRTE
jgi:membrane protein